VPAITPATAKAQASKVEEEVVEDDQYVLGEHLPLGAKGRCGPAATIHIGLGLGQEYFLAAQYYSDNLALYIRLMLPVNTTAGR
jgi:hypothetical protein